MAESLLQRVVAPLAADRDQLADAVADALALHQDTPGQCTTRNSRWPCTMVLALHEAKPARPELQSNPVN
ncbi:MULTISPECIES: hypothetical protein [unclassified Streptomyces]|uniref:hypothetical protein n=1 Tax=unclassified Streptomyces TaxID=2593676 RepID=UPI003248B5FA